MVIRWITVASRFHCPFEQPRGFDAAGAQSGDQGLVGARTTRRPFDDALSRPRSSKAPREAEICAAFIDEFQVVQLVTPFRRDSLLKQAAKTTNAWRVSQTIMQ